MEVGQITIGVSFDTRWLVTRVYGAIWVLGELILVNLWLFLYHFIQRYSTATSEDIDIKSQIKLKLVKLSPAVCPLP